MKKTILIILCILPSLVTFCQMDTNSFKAYKFEFGAGLGYEYGGIGLHLAFAPIPYFSTFIGLGINGGIGFNAGAVWHIIPKTTDHRFRPFFEAMYGYNLVEITVGDYYDVNQFYGLSLGLGCEFRNKKTCRHGFEICFPRYAFWSQAAWDAYNSTPDEEKSGLGPVGFSIGYHYDF